MLFGCGNSSVEPTDLAPAEDPSYQEEPASSEGRSADDVPGYSVSHSDVYEEAEIVCSLKPPREIARDFNLSTSDPDRIATRYARGYTAPLKQDAYEGCFDGMTGR